MELMSGFRFRPRVVLGMALSLAVSNAAVAQQPLRRSRTRCLRRPWLRRMRVPPPAAAQGRQKIGLVFEGGGALGLAHIGVIEWIEAHHIPVDYVAGTSMGGLVGGLYASGLSVDEIKAFVHRIDWDMVLNGQVPFQAVGYRRKEDKLLFPNRLEFGLKDGFSLPGGLNSGAAVSLLLIARCFLIGTLRASMIFRFHSAASRPI